MYQSSPRGIGQKRLEKEFSWDRIAEKTENVYSEILGLNRGLEVGTVRSKPMRRKTIKGEKFVKDKRLMG